MTEHQGQPKPLSTAGRLAILEAYCEAAKHKRLSSPDPDALSPLLRSDGISGGRLLHDATSPYFVVGIGEFSLRLFDPAGFAYLCGLTVFGPPPFITETACGSAEHPALVLPPVGGDEPLHFVALVADATVADTVHSLGSLIDLRAANLGVIVKPGSAGNAQDMAKRAALGHYDARASGAQDTMPISRAAYADLLSSLAWIMNATCGHRVCRLRQAVA